VNREKRQIIRKNDQKVAELVETNKNIEVQLKQLNEEFEDLKTRERQRRLYDLAYNMWFLFSRGSQIVIRKLFTSKDFFKS